MTGTPEDRDPPASTTDGDDRGPGAAAPTTPLGDDEGGDPPCWAGLIDDHRDRPADDRDRT